METVAFTGLQFAYQCCCQSLLVHMQLWSALVCAISAQ